MTAEEREKYCASLSERERRKTEGCKTEEEKREDAYQALLASRAQKERPTHSAFPRWLHLDGGWTQTTPSADVFGIFGAHITVANIGRVNFYGPPGAIILLEETPTGRRFTPGLTWGVSIHLSSFAVGKATAAKVYLDIAKCWVTANTQQGGLDMVGLSFSFDAR